MKILVHLTAAEFAKAGEYGNGNQCPIATVLKTKLKPGFDVMVGGWNVSIYQGRLYEKGKVANGKFSDRLSTRALHRKPFKATINFQKTSNIPLSKIFKS